MTLMSGVKVVGFFSSRTCPPRGNGDIFRPSDEKWKGKKNENEKRKPRNRAVAAAALPPIAYVRPFGFLFVSISLYRFHVFFSFGVFFCFLFSSVLLRDARVGGVRGGSRTIGVVRVLIEINVIV